MERPKTIPQADLDRQARIAQYRQEIQLRNDPIQQQVLDSVNQTGILPTLHEANASYNADSHARFRDGKEEDNFTAVKEAIAHAIGGTLEERREAVDTIFSLVERRERASQW